MRRQSEQFKSGKTLDAKVKSYARTWQLRCYKKGIPDEISKKLADSKRVPSWKAVAIAILENDHNLHSLGFGMRETPLSLSLMGREE